MPVGRRRSWQKAQVGKQNGVIRGTLILIKKVLTVYSAPQVAAIRIFSASLFMIPFATSWMSKIDKKYYLLIFVSGFIESFVPAFLFAIAQTQLDSAVTGIVNAMTPVFVILVGASFYSQRITLFIIVGLLIAFSGTTILMSGDTGENYSINYFAFFIVAATILYEINVNILKFNLKDLNPIAIANISFLFIGPIAAVQLFFSRILPSV